MRKPVLGIIISVLLTAFASHSVLAKPASQPVSSKKAVSKKAPQKTIKSPIKASKSRVSSKEAVKVDSSKLRKATLTPRQKASLQRAQLARSAQPSVTRERLIRKVVTVHGKRRVIVQRISFAPSVAPERLRLTVGDLAGLNQTVDPLDLKSSVAYVIDQQSEQVLFEKNANAVLPIASITKLMTALVVIEANQDLEEMLSISEEDVDKAKFSSSRLKVGVQLSRATMLHLALMSSENRAAAALGRNYPGGLPAFVAAMNAKARALGMTDTHYVDSSGLSSKNVASARDLAKLVVAAYQYPMLGQFSTHGRHTIDAGGRPLNYANTNHLVLNPEWDIGLQKTGYISEAGRCLVMQTRIDGRPVVMVFLDSKGKESRLGDAGRVRKWLEDAKLRTMS